MAEQRPQRIPLQFDGQPAPFCYYDPATNEFLSRIRWRGKTIWQRVSAQDFFAKLAEETEALATLGCTVYNVDT